MADGRQDKPLRAGKLCYDTRDALLFIKLVLIAKLGDTLMPAASFASLKQLFLIVAKEAAIKTASGNQLERD